MDLKDKVIEWFVERNLHEANPVKQFEKLLEESGELFEGVAKKKSDLIFDALGDIQVVLIGLEQQIKNGADIKASPEELELLLLVSNLGNLAEKLFSHIHNNDSMVPVVHSELSLLFGNVHALAIHNGSSADSCLSLAYDVIKDRKGKLVDGVFVKNEDL
ncbi:MazG-like family protein [Streptococcus suis]|uniref:DNA-binding protein n=1 Tax=Streptococcus suis TaxID=1307 RepID=A0A0Z8IPS5_STRSU|nr:MazG-like family protein [Streptococcus suis]NQG42620.1 hypothetical protein [Streptococcus suis]NQG72691.1 hypothetical protein [Streptococcus suis]NQQ50798.1 hypothetical protein [Streptococcus suis]CYV39415.1 DNA-binding protein [Streptococcus suis]CYV78767.1 DNA-binding protein [Streptococcus suis]